MKYYEGLNDVICVWTAPDKSCWRGYFSPAECKPIEVNGFLHEQCPSLDRYYTQFKCPRSNHTYFIYTEVWSGESVYSKLCPSDPGFYQACGHSGSTGSTELAGTPLLCGTFICDRNIATNWVYDLYQHCESGACKNTELNMVGCIAEKCNNICDEYNCSDESYCNGVQYGLWCEGHYVPPAWNCLDEKTDCINKKDAIEGCLNWTVDDHTTCQRIWTSKIIRIQDNMRCFDPGRSICENGQDQTNCSDPEKVVMKCLSEGFPTTISIWGYCKGYTLCDDGYNNVCVDPELGCSIHKGQLCDGHRDCNNGGDETNCKDLTKVTRCFRRFHSPNVEKNVSLPIPLEWVMDGEVDCLDGMDEDEEKWLKCGTDYYTRYQELETECEEVLLCPSERNFIDLNNLCDRINTCSFEEKLCNAARQTDVDVTTLTDTVITSQDQHFIQHCFPTGAEDLERKLGKCNTVEHTAGIVKTVINAQQPVLVSIPEKKVECSHLFGTNYVYAACNNICLNAECPLKKIPGDTCINKKDSVVRALAETAIPSTTTLFKTAKDPGFYDSKIFPCDNKRCVSYQDVCNLKDDCGDGSDENFCANHFKCNNYSELVVLSQVCDGVVHCRDFSDECSQSCSSTQNKDIFEKIFLRSAGVSMGLISTSLNTVSLVRSAWKLPRQKTYEMFLNTFAIVLINLGDLMIGVYLLLLSYFNFIYNADGNYCQEKYRWFSSRECSFLGVLSTTGSQLSLFAILHPKRAQVWSGESVYSKLCPSDPGFYQACGHSGSTGSTELAGTPLLCGTFICDRNIATNWVYDLYQHCESGACGNTDLNMRIWTSKIIRIQDSMRCFDPGRSICENGQDQTNCSDPEKVVLQCLSQGFPTTISIWGYCKGYTLCDDGYNNVCVDPELGCNIHKGQLCDGHLDCNNGGDETNCKDLTKVTRCIRRFHSPNVEKNVSLPIPLEWVMDGEMDCLDGMDEDEESWLKCGTDYYIRYQELETECKEVLLCPLEKNYIDLNNLCDRISTCSFEEMLCNAARQTDVDVTTLIDTFITSKDQHFIQHCFPAGAADLERQLGKCNTVEHTAGIVKTVVNVQQPVLVSIPEKKVDCSHLFGANYVYAACNNICINAECPLKKIPGDTCINEKDSVVRALADTAIPSTTTLFKTAKDPGFYDSKIFPCDNKRCVSYQDVCNLKDDCGDGSDENFCANHFKCNNYSELVVLSQVCDGVVHCRDFSDECSQICPSTQNKHIFAKIFLRSVSVSMGLISTSLNTVSLARSACKLPRHKTYEMFLNTFAIVLINLGDLMIGVYLLLLSYFDFIYNADGNYCEEKYRWFSSSECSSTGSQLSLFAMTMLSITRLANIETFVRRDLFSYKSATKLVFLLGFPLLACVLIAVTPILSFTEDYFVNGLYYYGSPLFIRPASKIDHYKVFKEYFEGRSVSWEKASFSWEAIRSTIKEMFSSDHGGILNSTVHFYGNDGVCVFKYLVTRDDPQWVFSTSILLVNFLCFIFILVSYGYINFKTQQSSRNVGAATGRRGANRALQAKISAIILTDFFCWVPLSIVSFLHLSEAINATTWYPFFSILIIPINSVINPLLYDSNFYFDLLFGPVRVLRRTANSFITAIQTSNERETVEGTPPLQETAL
eukprot:sb/3460770/